MKLIPSAVSRMIAQQGLLASENAPKILFVGGVAGMVGSTVLACRATLKVSDILERVEEEKRNHVMVKEEVEHPEYKGSHVYPDKEFQKDLTVITIKGFGEIAKLYAPAVLLGSVSIFALTKSHNLLKDRNLALTAAYAAVDGAFNRYRERVVDRFGEEVDHELRYDFEVVDEVDEETGEITSSEVITGAPGVAYKRYYDELSSPTWSPNPNNNQLFLLQVQNYVNDRLNMRGHFFLNEVFTELGLSHTKDGAIVGWRKNKDSGANYIDFGIFEGENFKHAFNGREGAILLSFNVDGVIYDKIEEGA